MPSHIAAFDIALAGAVTVSVLENGRVLRTLPTQRNLILDSGMDMVESNTWQGLMAYGVAGTGSTPTKDILDGTWSQTGTTIVSSGSSYTLTSGDIGKWIGFANGTQAKITAIISGTSATVAQSQTVAAMTANLYRAGQTGLAVEAKRSNTYPSFTAVDGLASQGHHPDQTAQKMRVRRTFDFTAEVSDTNYTEIGVSPSGSAGNNLFARILLSGAVTVLTGQQLRVQYDLILQCSGIQTHPTSTLAITGWPVPFSIASITASGSAWTVTTTTAHNYATGGKVNIAGALPPKVAVVTATSTPTDFTIETGAAHGRSVGDQITLEDMVPTAYNGTWTVATIGSATVLTVTTAANPGTGTAFGTLRLATPATWFDGTNYTVASTPTATTFTITNTATPPAAGASGTVYSNLNAAYYAACWGVGPYYPSLVSGNARAFLEMTSSVAAHGFSDGLKTPAAFTTDISSAPPYANRIAPTTNTKTAYVNGNWFQDHVSTFDAGTLNYTNIQSFAIAGGNSVSFAANASAPSQALFNLEEPQVKANTHSLTITVRRSWNRVLA